MRQEEEIVEIGSRADECLNLYVWYDTITVVIRNSICPPGSKRSIPKSSDLFFSQQLEKSFVQSLKVALAPLQQKKTLAASCAQGQKDSHSHARPVRVREEIKASLI